MHKQDYNINNNLVFIISMYNFFTKSPTPQNHQDVITAVKQQIFNFKVKNQTNIKNDMFVTHKNIMPSSFGPLKQQWRPKINFKKIIEDPKFLMSVERKKIKMMNTVQDKDFQNHNEIVKNEIRKSNRLKLKSYSESKPKKHVHFKNLPENYTHASLDFGRLDQNHRTVKTPYLNFNLHHLIKQRKSLNSMRESRSHKKGPALIYSTLMKSEKLERNTYQNDKDYLTIQNTTTLELPYTAREAKASTIKSIRQARYTVRCDRKYSPLQFEQEF